jgi:hypothetical protein
MVNPVSSANQYAAQVSQPAARQPQPAQQQAAQVQDKVSFSSVSHDVDHDGDSR